MKPLEIRQKFADHFKTSFWVTDEEANILQSLAKNFSLYFESGTAHGFSSYCVGLSMSEGNIYTFDPNNRNKIWPFLPAPNAKIHYICNSFVLCETHTAFTTRRSKSLIFIDGGHRRSQISADWDAVKTNLVSGDIVVFHDVICERGCVRFWDSIKRNYDTETIKTDRGMGIVRL